MFIIFAASFIFINLDWKEERFTQTHKMTQKQEPDVNDEIAQSLAKLIEIVPNLRDINDRERIERIVLTTSQPFQLLTNRIEERPQLALNFNNKIMRDQTVAISDLEIIQHAIDYIRELKHLADA